MAAQVGTDLYRRILTFDFLDEDRLALMRKVWSPTPWVVDAFVGSPMPGHEHFQRYSEIRQWLAENLGEESWPIHGHDGRYHFGGSTVNGWTWIGFADEADMRRFVEAWPTPEDVTAA